MKALKRGIIRGEEPIKIFNIGTPTFLEKFVKTRRPKLVGKYSVPTFPLLHNLHIRTGILVKECMVSYLHSEGLKIGEAQSERNSLVII